MMAAKAKAMGKKPGNRLKPVRSDALESVGFVSKGDHKYAPHACPLLQGSRLTGKKYEDSLIINCSRNTLTRSSSDTYPSAPAMTRT